ncbi:efflux RND transporter periplasmic adaptor subunit [Limibacillus halophilus]|uniref:RND family efflux transporter MFP subunit n=1 Tax=Limibacillus halophilus TaxID=1579333 RepID=A0A839STJ3_9PROT|nr:efflux RND transporter periplasmic adaptor subunit [Limibacillus halophilus]MBB3065648.1 RND family efflux transporter MFP subunit [Limibacillus halophilus]
MMIIAIAILPTGLRAQTPGQAPQVSVVRAIEKEIVEWDEFTGRFEAVKFVDVRARVSGYLESAHFTDGQFVEKGDLLFVIDPRPFEAAVDLAQANVARFESELELAILELKRAERLLPNKNIAREEYDSRVANKKVQEAQLRAAKAELRSAELDLAFTEVRAPVSGRISSAEVDEGNLIEAASGASTRLTTIVSQDPIHFVFDVSESDYLKYIRLNSVSGVGNPTVAGATIEVELRLMDEKDWPRRGKIDFVDTVFDRGTGTLRLRATFENKHGILVPGLFARLRLPAKTPAVSIVIPEVAVLSDQSTKIVLTVDPEGTVIPRPVVLGPSIDGLVVIREGLTLNDEVIVKGLLRARPGSKVAPEVISLEALQGSTGGGQ